MSEENVEIVRSMYRRGDPNRLFDLLDEEVEVDAPAAGLLPDHSELVSGKDAEVEYFLHYWGAWDAYVPGPTEIIDAGEDRVLVLHYEQGRARGSGTPFEHRGACLYTLRAGKLVRFRTFATHEEGLEAVGVSE